MSWRPILVKLVQALAALLQALVAIAALIVLAMAVFVWYLFPPGEIKK